MTNSMTKSKTPDESGAGSLVHSQRNSSTSKQQHVYLKCGGLRSSYDIISDLLYEIENDDDLLELYTAGDVNDEKIVDGMNRWKKQAKEMFVSYVTSTEFSLVEKGSKKRKNKQKLTEQTAGMLFEKCCVFYNKIARSTLELHNEGLFKCIRPFLLNSIPNSSGHVELQCFDFDHLVEFFDTSLLWEWQYTTMVSQYTSHSAFHPHLYLHLLDSNAKGLIISLLLTCLEIVAKCVSTSSSSNMSARDAFSEISKRFDSTTMRPLKYSFPLDKLDHLKGEWSKLLFSITTLGTDCVQNYISRESSSSNQYTSVMGGNVVFTKNRAVTFGEVFDFVFGTQPSAISFWSTTVRDMLSAHNDDTVTSSDIVSLLKAIRHVTQHACDLCDDGTLFLSSILHDEDQQQQQSQIQNWATTVANRIISRNGNETVSVDDDEENDIGAIDAVAIKESPQHAVADDKFGQGRSDKDENHDAPVEEEDAAEIEPQNSATGHRTTNRFETTNVCFPNEMTLTADGCCTSCNFPWNQLRDLKEMIVKLKDNAIPPSWNRDDTEATERHATESPIAEIQPVPSEEVTKRKRFSSPTDGTLLIKRHKQSNLTAFTSTNIHSPNFMENQRPPQAEQRPRDTIAPRAQLPPHPTTSRDKRNNENSRHGDFDEGEGYADYSLLDEPDSLAIPPSPKTPSDLDALAQNDTPLLDINARIPPSPQTPKIAALSPRDDRNDINVSMPAVPETDITTSPNIRRDGTTFMAELDEIRRRNGGQITHEYEKHALKHLLGLKFPEDDPLDRATAAVQADNHHHHQQQQQQQPQQQRQPQQQQQQQHLHNNSPNRSQSNSHRENNHDPEIFIIGHPADTGFSLERFLNNLCNNRCLVKETVKATRTWFNEYIRWDEKDTPLILPENGEYRDGHHFVSVSLSILVYEIYNNLYTIASQRDTWEELNGNTWDDLTLKIAPEAPSLCKLEANTFTRNLTRYRRFNIVVLSVYDYSTDKGYGNWIGNIIGVITRTNESRSKLKLDVQIVGWSDADETIVEGKIFAAMLQPVDFIGTEHAKMESLKMFFTLPDQIQTIVLGKRSDPNVTLFTPFSPFPAHLTRPTLNHVQEYVRATDLCEGSKMFIVNCIEGFDTLNATTATTPEGTQLPKLNFEQVYVVTEACRLVRDFELKRPSQIGCPAYMLNLIGPAGTGKTGCILSMLSALYSSSKTSGIVRTIEQSRREYMEQYTRDIDGLLDARLANAYERCIQPSEYIRVLIVAPTHKALDVLEDRISKGIPVQHVTTSNSTEGPANNPTLETETFTFFPLYQRTAVLEGSENSAATKSKDERIDELSMQKRNHSPHLRTRFMGTVVLSTIGSVSQAFSGSFYMGSREKEQRPQYDLVINDESSYNDDRDVVHLLWNTVQYFAENGIPYISCGDPLQGGPTVLGQHTYFTDIASESFLKKVCPPTYSEGSSSSHAQSLQNHLVPAIYLKSQYRMHPTIGSITGVISGRQVISRKPVSAFAQHLLYTASTLYTTANAESVSSPTHEILTTPVVLWNPYKETQRSDLANNLVRNFTPGRLASMNEAIPVVHCVSIMLQDRVYKSRDIIVTSPYKHQVDLIRHMLATLDDSLVVWDENDGDDPTSYSPLYVRVLTTKTVQGLESGVLFFTPSRSQTGRGRSGRMGASAFPVQLSHVYVALSRAINQLIVVGDIDYLARESDIWHRILTFVTNRN